MSSLNSFSARSTLSAGGETYVYFDLKKASENGLGDISKLPMSLKVLLENLLRAEDGVAVKIDGKLFTRYVTKSGVKPILWPIIGPNGKEITRQYPMREALATEKADHPHQRSLWFSHGDVNGTSFWHENEGAGTIKHREFTKIEGGQRPVIQTTNDWITPAGDKVCEDVRTFTFGADDHSRWIDLEVTVKAPADK